MKTSNVVWTIAVLLIIAGLIWYVMQTPQPGSDIGQTGPSATSTQTAPGGAATSTATSGTEPRITSLAPSAGKANTTVTITGTGFDPNDNLVAFGSPGGKFHKDGTPDNVLLHASSTSGTSITFVVPAGKPSGELCDQTGQNCTTVTAEKRTPGSYDVTIINKNGISNATPFVLQ